MKPSMLMPASVRSLSISLTAACSRRTYSCTSSFALRARAFIAIMPTRPAQPHAPAVERLAEILTVRRQLSDAKVAAENASRLLEDAMLQRLSHSRIARLAADIDLLDGHLVDIVAADAALVHRYRLLTSMPGVGRSWLAR